MGVSGFGAWCLVVSDVFGKLAKEREKNWLGLYKSIACLIIHEKTTVGNKSRIRGLD